MKFPTTILRNAMSMLLIASAPTITSAQTTHQVQHTRKGPTEFRQTVTRRAVPERIRLTISVNPRTPVAPSMVRFRVSPSQRLPRGTRLMWSFSDGERAQGRKVLKQVSTPGRLRVQVKAVSGQRQKLSLRGTKGARTIVIRGGQAATPTATPSPSQPPSGTPSYTCNNSLQIIDHFAESPVSDLGETITVIKGPNQGLVPSHIQPAHPLPETATIFQLDFEDVATPGAESSSAKVAAVCDNCPVIQNDGRIGKAASFDGTSGLLTGAQLNRYNFANKDITWAMWFRSNSTATQSLLGSYCGFGHLESRLRLTNGQLQFFIDPASGNGTTLTSAATNLSNNAWHHVAAIRRAATGVMELYIDGELDSTTTGAILGGDINCSRFAIGMSSLGFPAQLGFRGSLDGIALYERALSADEVAHLASAARTTGEFRSRKITLSQPAYSISALPDEVTIGRTTIEVSVDGNTWCEINGELDDPRCPYPAQEFWYRAKFHDQTELHSVQLDIGCSARCIDYDNDGYTAIPVSAPYCDGPTLDCNDRNAFETPQAASPSCSCSGQAPIVEACDDGLDNDCDGAIDDDDSQCYNAGTIYYFSNSEGLDSNTGTTPDSPRQTLSMAQSLLNNSIRPGDKILFRRGDTWNEGTLNLRTQATSDLPLKVGTYGVGARAHFHYDTPATAITIDGASYVTIEGIHVTRSSKTVAVTGVGFNPQHLSSNITIRDLHLDGLGYGMLVYATNFLLEDSILNDNENSQSGGGHSQGLWVYGGSDYGIVRNNIFQNNGKRGVIFDHNVYLGGGNFWLFEGNDFSGDSGTSIVFHGIQEGHIIRGNSFHDNTRAPAIDISDYTTGQYLQNFIVERNRIFNNPAGAFWIRGAVNLTVRNNLIYNNPSVFNIGSGFDHQTSMLVQHNTFYGNGGSSLASGGTYTFSGNLYSTSPNLGGGITVDPANYLDVAAGDFRLVSSSAAIDTAPATSLSNDYLGQLRPIDGDQNGSALPDYGALEFVP